MGAESSDGELVDEDDGERLRLEYVNTSPIKRQTTVAAATIREGRLR